MVQEEAVDVGRLSGQRSTLHVEPGESEKLCASTLNSLIGVVDSEDHLRNPGSKYGLGARWGSTVMVAGFECDIKGGAPTGLTCASYRVHLGMG